MESGFYFFLNKTSEEDQTTMKPISSTASVTFLLVFLLTSSMVVPSTRKLAENGLHQLRELQSLAQPR